jgi:hypothetical protein
VDSEQQIDPAAIIELKNIQIWLLPENGLQLDKEGAVNCSENNFNFLQKALSRRLYFGAYQGLPSEEIDPALQK